MLLAALDTADADHAPCTEPIGETSENLIVPALVLSELGYWCRERLTVDVWLAFLEDTLAGAYNVESPTREDLGRWEELQRSYVDLAVGVVDASVLAPVERLDEPKLARLDQRHFATTRPRHAPAPELLPGSLAGSRRAG